MEFKPCATRDVTGYGEPLRVIVLPNGWGTQVAQRGQLGRRGGWKAG